MREDFCNLVSIWWKEVPNKASSILTFVAKLRYCGKRIKERCSSSYHCISRSLKILAEEIHKLDLLEERFSLTHE